MKLVVGLGNPGKKYTRTRHNVGAMVVRRLAEQLRMPLTQRRFKGLWTTGQEGRQKLLLLLPRTYMNASGTAVRPAAAFFDLPVEHVIVVYDDIDLPFGRIRVKVDGGAGGHRGVESIIKEMGTPAFVRIRVGIAHPGGRDDVTRYVLEPFDRDERDELPRVIDDAVAATLLVVRRGPEVAMNQFNTRERPALMVSPVARADEHQTHAADDGAGGVLETISRRGLG